MLEAIINVLCFFWNCICILAKFFLKPELLPFVVLALIGMWIKHQMN